MSSNSNNRPSGIGGWLSIFLVGLFVVIPLYGIIGLTDYLEMSSSIRQGLPNTYPFFLLDMLIIVAEIIFGIIVGIMIVSQRPQAIIFAKLFIVVTTFTTLFEPFLLSIGGEVKISELFGSEDYGSQLFRQIVYFVIWYSYFSVSKRVKNTFPFTRLSQIYTWKNTSDHIRNFETGFDKIENNIPEKSYSKPQVKIEPTTFDTPKSVNSGDLFENSSEGTMDYKMRDQMFADILGLKGKIMKSDITKRYQELIKKYDPEEVTEMGEEFVSFAKKQRREINKAYLYFKKKYDL